MKHQAKSILSCAALAAAIVVPSAAEAGSKVEIEVDDKRAKAKHKMHITITDDGMRMDGTGAPGDEPFGVILFHKTGRMVMLQPTEKKYMEFRKDGVMAQYNQNKDKLTKQYEEAFKKMSPEKREMMKNMLPGFKPKPTIKYVKGKADKVAGYPCTLYKKYSNDKLTQEFCFTKGKDFKPILKAVEKSEKIWNQINPGQGNDFLKTEYGVPLRTVTYSRSGKIEEIQTLTKYEPKVLFKKSPIAIPAGYTKQNMDVKAPKQ